MIECVARNRNKSGVIISYTLHDTDTNTSVVLKSEELKYRMMNGFRVHNLKLSKTCAILMNTSIDESGTHVDFCAQSKESKRAYKEMIEGENRDLTEDEKQALNEFGGFFVIIDEDSCKVEEVERKFKEAIKSDMEEYINKPYKGRLNIRLNKMQIIDKKRAELEKPLDISLSKYTHVINAIVSDNYGYSKAYRVLLREKIK